MKIQKPRTLVLGAGAVSVVLGGGIALAYWTSLGTGTGTAHVGTDGGVSVSQNGTVTGLVPGGSPQPIDFTVTNNSATVPVQIRSVTIGFGSFAPGCSAADFTLTQPSKPSTGTPVSIAGSGSVSFTSAGSGTNSQTGASIAMLNTGADQDGCKLATVNLTFTVS
ncbi:MAG: hypothetical protein WB441_18165 [Nocardioidaceae bacterium]